MELRRKIFLRHPWVCRPTLSFRNRQSCTTRGYECFTEPLPIQVPLGGKQNVRCVSTMKTVSISPFGLGFRVKIQKSDCGYLWPAEVAVTILPHEFMGSPQEMCCLRSRLEFFVVEIIIHDYEFHGRTSLNYRLTINSHKYLHCW